MASSQKRQWRQLLALAVAHAVADTYVGIVTPVIAPICDQTGISLTMVVFIAALLGFSANMCQVLVGHLHVRHTSPALLYAGVMVASLAVLIPCLPGGTFTLAAMAALAVAAGFGVALVHPEGLRAVHGLDAIPVSVATSVFMVAGFAGFSSGAFFSSMLTEKLGLAGIAWLALAAPAAVLLLAASGLRLPAEGETAAPAARRENVPQVPFMPLLVMATVLSASAQIQATFLPTYLHKEAGYPLSFSGLSFTLFGLGGMVGAVVWGALAPRLGHLRILLFCSLAGAPLTLAYLLLARHSRWAAALIALAGLIVYTGFPFCITLAQYARSSLRFSQRMGMMSGGTWGVAALGVWALGPAAERVGMWPALHLVWVGYLATAALTLVEMRRCRPARREGG